MPPELGQVAIAIGVPAAALLAGAAAGLWRRPGPRLRSACQHLAAGIIFAAVATELVPPMVRGPSWIAVGLGFAAGVILMLGIRAVFSEAQENQQADGRTPRIPVGMLAGMGVDLAIDGLLVALALDAGEAGGMVLAGGVSFETLFLGLALAAMLAGRRRLLIVSAIILALTLVLGGVLGVALLGLLSGPWRLALLSFGCAALLYLVTEELLVEAHHGEGDSIIGSAMFFVGFGITLAIAAAAG
jgi:ZIP family zinc transporter